MQASVTIPTAAQLAVDCSDSVFQAMQETKREIKDGVLRSRGKWIRVIANGDSLLDNGECEFKGTQKQIDEIVAKYKDVPGLEAIYIEGGIDWAACVRDFGCGDYEPWVAEWAVNILVKE